MRIHRIALPILAAMLQTACGGGGGGSSGSNPPPPPPPTGDTITAANGQQIATGVVTSTLFVKALGLPDAAGPFVPTAVLSRPTGAKTALTMAVGGGIRRGITAMRGIEATPINCSLGGSITITTTIANEGALTVGDVVSAVFDACAEVDGTLNGAVDLTVNSVTGDVANPPYSAGLDVTIDQVSLTQADTLTSANGALGATISSTTPQDLEILLSGTELTTLVGDDTIVLRDFSIDEVDDLNTGGFTLDVTGTFDSAALGTYGFATATTFTGAGGAFPSAGELVITGDAGTSAHVIAVDDVNVRVELDTDGDGTTDESTDTTWADIGG